MPTLSRKLGLCLLAVWMMPGAMLRADEPAASSTPPAASAAWKAGFARRVITPAESIWLAGYAARTRPADGKLQELYAKAMALEDPAGHRLVLITTDLRGMRAAFTGPIAEELKRRHGLDRHQLMFTSSHTHSGPLLSDAMDNSVYYPVNAEQAEKIRRYTQGLREQILELVSAALADLEPARLSWTVGRAGFAVNRREPTANGIILGRNRLGPVDHDVPLLRVESAEGKLRALAFAYACHNTTLADYVWCGDYAGFAQAFLEQAHPGVQGMFFMGCGADANPLPRRSVELCRSYGRELAEGVENALRGSFQPITGGSSSQFEAIELPLDRLPTRAELEKEAAGKPSYTQRRAALLLDRLGREGRFASHYPYPIQVWQLGRGLTWIALGGEVVVDYSQRLRRELGPGVWVGAYANDVMGYIPSARVLREGGYEATITSGELAGSCWGPDTEARIISKVHQLVAQAKGAARARRDDRSPGPGQR